MLLVLGAGGTVSQGLIRALDEYEICAADVYEDSPGLYDADIALISPFADDPSFLEWLYEVIALYDIEGILSGVEPILDVLSHNQDAIEWLGVKCVVSPPHILEIAQDKLKTSQWLAANGFPHPPFLSSGWGMKFPMIAKPRFGRGSLGMKIINSAKEIVELDQSQYVIQEMVGDEDHEYTIGCFCDRDGEFVNQIIFRRSLFAGTTWVATIDNNPIIADTARAIMEKLRPVGPCNLQMRLVDDQALTFEINMRFSSSSIIRHMFGFSEARAAVAHLIYGLSVPALNPPEEGYALRRFGEMIINPTAPKRLQERKTLNLPYTYVEKGISHRV